MVLPGHLAGGYLAARGLLAVFHPGFSTAEIDALLIIGTLAGDLPDIDLARWYFEGKGDHRKYFTHGPFFWLLISLAIATGGYLSGSVFTEWIGWLILASSWVHLLFDSIEDGVMWLWPWSKKLFLLLRESPRIIVARAEKVTAPIGSLTNHFQYITRVYMRRPTSWVEITITIAAICLFLASL
jgi:hypothetical protein